MRRGPRDRRDRPEPTRPGHRGCRRRRRRRRSATPSSSLGTAARCSTASGSCGTTSLLHPRLGDIGCPAARSTSRAGSAAGSSADGTMPRATTCWSTPRPIARPAVRAGRGCSTIRLRDGTAVDARDLGSVGDVSAIPPPLRLRHDGWTATTPSSALDGRDRRRRRRWRLRPRPSLDDPASRSSQARTPDAEGPADRIAWLDADGLHAERLRASSRTAVQVATDQTMPSTSTGSPIDRWACWHPQPPRPMSSVHGAVECLARVDRRRCGCPDLVLPGAILPCGVGRAREPARPGSRRASSTAMPIEGRRAAADRGRDSAGIRRSGCPHGPTPWAAAPAGWWRHGPSTPFVRLRGPRQRRRLLPRLPGPEARPSRRPRRSDGSTILPGLHRHADVRQRRAARRRCEEGPDVAPTQIDGLLEAPDA